ncbi:MAG: hypothetical protein BMS9Abin28_2526 [Anaerolineae bacterium]|nr:MAG: hypothetical protein BMS9Abin28_2526 [Anaerolineae bacterium]
MPQRLSPDHPNLQKAVSRLRRVLFAWAVLFAGMAVLTFLTSPGVIPIQWMTGLALLILSAAPDPTHGGGYLGLQPALLGLVSITWALSLLGLVPAINQVFALDPIVLMFQAGLIESLALAFVRGILVLMAWNQLLFYRMLYGTRGTIGLEPGAPDIPEVVSNRTALLETYSRWAGIIGGGLILAAFLIPNSDLVLPLLSSSLGAGMVAVGLGVGVAFSPTDRRPAALASIMVGGIIFVVSMGSARLLGL